jgi:glutamyl-tRNA synthetase
MHVGGVRTALFAWIVAKQNKGDFILRIEDTDKNREVKGSEAHIIESLKWLGIDWDEGPDKDGPTGPYRQSQRLDIYRKWAEKLVASGRAYADPYTSEEVQAFREQAQKDKQPFLYRKNRPDSPDNETPKWDGTTPLRFKSDPKSYSWHDEIMGDLHTGSEVIDDFILMKSDGYPTYNFAHIVDDAMMKITHIIRGQEFISSMPNYLNLYEALDLKHPIFTTVPHILAPTGNKKLGKRDGAKDILEYRDQGYLPEAFINFLATLGWNDGTDQEIYSINELIENFSIDRVQKSGARFDERKLLWINGSYIRNLSVDQLMQKSESFFPKSSTQYDNNYKMLILALIQDRLKYFGEIPQLTHFFFEKPEFQHDLIRQNKQLSKVDNKLLVELLNTAIVDLEKIDFNDDDLKKCLDRLLEKTGEKPAILLGIIRTALTRAPSSPELSGSLSVLGKEESISRLKEVMLKLNQK